MTSIPKTPIKGDAETRRFLEALRQAVLNLDGTQVTTADLKSQSFWDNLGVDIGGSTTLPDGILIVQQPTVPLNLTATGIFQNIILEWTLVPYKGHAFTRIYRNTVNNFSTAAVLATANSTTYADNVSSGAGFYYWVTNVNANGVESAPNAVAGTFGQTQQDVGYMLNLLNNSITDSQLYQTLGDRIDLIDAPASVAGSVNARISTVSSQVGSNTTSIQTLTSTTNGLSGQYTVKIDNNGYVSGYGLASTANNATPSSDFAIRADRFYVASPSGPGVSPSQPFTVITTPTTINGVTIQPGAYINSAYIMNASIDSAKVRDLQADKITAGRLKVAIGLDGDLNVGTGKVVFDNGIYMKVQGVGFGSTNQFLEWFGPKQSSFVNCTESNAIAYLKTNGDAYFGGSLSAGVLRNAGTTSLQTANAEIVVGPFSSNGNPKQVVLSYSYFWTRNITDQVSYSGSTSATILLQRSFDGTNWTTISTLNVTGSVSGDDGFGQFEPGYIQVQMGGSTTFTDTNGPGSNYHYRGIIASRTLPTINSTQIGTASVSQLVTVVSTES